jgi:hypothetical protein
MKFFWLFFLIFIFAPNLSGQNYYVAVVKGKVYYQNKLLKKRDKLKMKGVIRFTSQDDYIKVSGPGGLYRIDPTTDPKSSNEFLVAVREELFPKIREHDTSQDSWSANYNDYFYQSGGCYTFLEKSDLRRETPQLKKGEELGFLHETDQGLFYKTAVVEKRKLAIRKKDFTLVSDKKQDPVLKQTAIVQVLDKQKWKELIQGKDSISQILKSTPRYGAIPADTYGYTFDPEKREMNENKIPYPAIILDYMGPPRFVNRRKLMKDLRFHLKQCKASDIETFLGYFEYESYIWDTYGHLKKADLDKVLREDLKLTSQYDGSFDPIE